MLVSVDSALLRYCCLRGDWIEERALIPLTSLLALTVDLRKATRRVQGLRHRALEPGSIPHLPLERIR